MQTCPFCHNVLVSPICCVSAHGNQQEAPPMAFALNSAHLHSAAPCQQRPAIEASLPHISCMASRDEAQKPNQRVPLISSLPTPHVSGHMFHFPSVNNELVQRLSGCQLTCQVNCLMHGPLPPSPVVCRENPFDSIHCRQGNYIRSTLPSNQTLSPESEDILRLKATSNALKQSGWYWDRLSWQEAEVILQPTSVGTFLMRDSADPNHRFSLSVQTEKGPTSVRIHFIRGKFSLKCEASIKASLPEFPCVIRLIEHYIKTNLKYNNQVWVDAAGKVYSPIRISKPLFKYVPSLKHLSRRATSCYYSRTLLIDRLPLSMLKYIDDYPYWC